MKLHNFLSALLIWLEWFLLVVRASGSLVRVVYLVILTVIVNTFTTMFHHYFLMFSGDVEVEHWLKMA